MKTHRTLIFAFTTAVSVAFVAGAAFMHYFSAVAGGLNPSAPPGPTMKTLDEVEPRIPISSVPFTVAQPGSYYLTGDLESTGDGIVVDEDNVTIDLMGYTLKGAGLASTYGILMSGHSGVEVRNGVVASFGYGLYGDSTSKSRAIDLRVLGNGSTGVHMSGKVNLVRDCTVAENGQAGIAVGDHCQVLSCDVHDNGFVGISASKGATITANNCSSNGHRGILANLGSVVVNNVSYQNEHDGIYGGSGSCVRGNTVYDNGGRGILASQELVIDNNTVYSNAQEGIYSYGWNKITGNTVSDNGKEGINSADKCIISGNTVRNNTYTGIYAGSQCTVTDNLVTGNNTAELANHHGIRLNLYCLAKGNHLYANNTSNLFVENSCNNIEGNTTTGSAKGIWLSNSSNLYINNRAAGNTIDYDVVAGNTDGGGNISY